MSLLQRLNPSIVPTSFRERLRASLGALLGVATTGFVSTLALGPSHAALPLLIAPTGASAVLLFAAPSSPLAQPWSVVGGNLIASVVGVTCALMIGNPLIAASLAIALSIILMLMANCLHPPSGAVALTAVLGGPAIHDAGYWFVLSPVGANSLLLLAIALAFNNVTGRRYPHLAPKAGNPLHGTRDPLPTERLGAGLDDVTAAIREYDEVLPVSPEDVEHLMKGAESRALGRLRPLPLVADIMSRDVLSVDVTSDLRSALRTMAAHRLEAVPAIGKDGRVAGVLRLQDFATHAAFNTSWRRHLTIKGRKNLPKTVADILPPNGGTARPDTPLAALVPAMADGGAHLTPITDERGRLLGVVTQSDLLAAMFRIHALETMSPLSAAS
jgi:CBS-domain-containing membrane protein